MTDGDVIAKEGTQIFDVQKIRQDFPLLSRQVYNKNLIYLDNAATSQKPQQVIDTIIDYYTLRNSNIHRGVHALAAEATEAYENSREKVREFINAKHSHEIIFTRGTTESINLVAYSWGRKNIKEGDEIIISEMEHHSNIVPWQMLCEDKKAKLKFIPFTDDGELILEELDNLITSKTKLISVVHVSNTLGTINPVKEIIARAHAAGVPVLVDGAQAAPHFAIDVQDLDCDFYTISGHKMFGPTGSGILYGKENFLNDMPPFQGGGEMIKSVTMEGSTYNELPFKFEAGTPNIEGGIGIGTAIDYLKEIGRDDLIKYEHELLNYATAQLKEIKDLRIIGEAKNKVPVISFLVGKIHPYDLGTLLDKMGIAIRTGHHCTQPIMDRFKIPGTCRASFAFYNTKEEVDILVEAIEKAKKMLS
ncbi:MAG: aminotransferase class V-fold PLP-dependent enzyme [Bacteroidia bacterium]